MRIQVFLVFRFLLNTTTLTQWSLCYSSETNGIEYSFFTYRNGLLLLPLTLSFACHRGELRSSNARPPWNFLIRQIRIRLFTKATAPDSPGGASWRRFVETMDQRITQPSAVPYFPWTLDAARLPGARQSDENGSNDGNVGIDRAKG